MTLHEKNILPLLARAGELVLSAHNVEAEGGVTEKAEDAANLVTRYDGAVQALLLEGLSALYPDAAFVSEEKENDPAVLTSARCFVIDPIDGTANFVHGMRRSAISLAMLEEGETVFAAVSDPYLGEVFTAERGCGAFLNGKRLSVSHRDLTHALTVFGTSPYYKDSLTAPTFRLAERLFQRTRDIRRSGSAALDLAYVAAGRCDIFFECALQPWDFAAAALLLAEAGGIITDMKGAPLSLAAPTSVIAANAECYPYLLSETKSLLP